MPRPTALPTAPSPAESAERLSCSVDQLAQNIAILTDVVDDIREDLSWLLRNGVPHQEVVVRIDQLARNPAASDWRDRVRRLTVPTPQESRGLDAERASDSVESLIDQLVARLAEPLGELAQEQLNILLGVLESARREIGDLIRNRPSESLASGSATTELCQSPSASVRAEDRPPGSLF